MADFYTTDDAETVKVWKKELWREHRRADVFFDDRYGFLGTDPNKSPFILLDELEKGPGDRIRSIYTQELQGRGVGGDETMRGKEESLLSSTDDIVINELIWGVTARGRMTLQRIPFDAYKEVKSKLAQWHKNRRNVWAANHLCGNTRQTDLIYTGFNTVTAVDDEHIYRVGIGLESAAGGTDEAVEAAPTFTIDVNTIDTLVTIAEQLDPPIAPFVLDGNPYYALLLHPDCVDDLRQSDTQWYATMQAALQGGERDKNPLFTRALGKWRDTLIFSSPHIVRGIHSSTGAAQDNVRRNVFLGAGALQLAYGRAGRGEQEHMVWYNGQDDHGRVWFASAGLIGGCNAVFFDHKPPESASKTSRTSGRIVVSSHSATRYKARDLHQEYA